MKENSYRLKIGYSLNKHEKKTKQKVWRDVSQAVLASRKNRPAVNVAEISRNSKAGAKVLVPGKVLGAGSLNHKVIVAAYSFSDGARAKIVAAGGECVGLLEFMNSTNNAKDVLVLG